MMRLAVLFLFAPMAFGCTPSPESSSEDGSKATRAGKKKGKTAAKGDEQARGGLSLKKKKGASLRIEEMVARPNISVLSGVDGVAFPGAARDAYNTFQLSFEARAKRRITAGEFLFVRYKCQFRDSVIAGETPVKLRKMGKGKVVSASSTSSPLAPELGMAKACQFSFRHREVALGTVCVKPGATTETAEIALRPCEDSEVRLTNAAGSGFHIAEPSGRVAHEGAAAWFLITAKGAVAGTPRPKTTLSCHDAGGKTREQRHHGNVRLEQLEAGESMMVSVGAANLKWLTRDTGRCELAIALDGMSKSYCIERGRVEVGACDPR